MAEKEAKVEVEGEIVESLRGRMFRIRLDNGHEAIGYTSGKMKRYRIRMLPGDRVRIELSAYDLVPRTNRLPVELGALCPVWSREG